MKSEILREEVVFPAVLWAHASRSRGVKYHRYAPHGVDISRGDDAVVVDIYYKPIVLRVVVVGRSVGRVRYLTRTTVAKAVE